VSAPGTPGIGVLLSGSGRTLLNLHERIESGDLPARIAFVVASRECLGADRARSLGYPTSVVPGDVDPSTLGAVARDHGASIIALAGYLRLAPIPEGYAGRVVNIHPALLPSFGGAGMYGMRVHTAVLEAGCKVSGCTAHLCDDRYDTGPILAQRACAVLEGDTPESLAERVFALEREVFPEAIRAMAENRVEVSPDGRRARIIPA